ncbi:65-kDa microtubule-associated protein 1-like isoform X2 [Papaver somniferum]|uniref:65-kDa microtubule-associated protein 1-like isoform X2 n=1 Tax=Papaver somniferum TaxID=3469 RepID=UPI000E6FEDD0|nr:65-kDa microtubule-associated protein 1-like isoform X2 [Papaver somniferum]
MAEYPSFDTKFQQLQKTWDVVGANEFARRNRLFEIVRECRDIYRRQFDQTGKWRARLCKVLEASLNLENARTTHFALLQELQQIWVEVGKTGDERDKALLHEYLDVYRRIVGRTVRWRADLLQLLSDAKAKLFSLGLALGNENVPLPNLTGTINQQL